MKRSKAGLLIICAVVLLVVIGLTVSALLPAAVSLSSLQKGETFQFRHFNYGLSVGAVKLLWTASLEPHNLPGQEVYLSRNSGKIDGKIADVYFYFQEGKLFQVSMTVKDCDGEWFNGLVEDTRQLYGEEAVNAENEVYKWYKGDSILCLSAPSAKGTYMGDIYLIVTYASEN